MPSQDKFQNRNTGYVGPATQARAITPDDNNDLIDIPRWFTVETGGTFNIDLLENEAADNPISLVVEAGQVIFVRAKRVYATGTSASGIVAYW